MHNPNWKTIELFYKLPNISPQTIIQFKQLKHTQSTYTRDEGNLHHYCTFFLPYHANSNYIYLGHHKKANDWIPPGGHIDLAETPQETIIREMKEELRYEINSSQLTPFSLSVKYVNRPQQGCMAHYDIWYLVKLATKPKFNFDTREYYNADWFPIEIALTKINHNPDFRQIIAQINKS